MAKHLIHLVIFEPKCYLWFKQMVEKDQAPGNFFIVYIRLFAKNGSKESILLWVKLFMSGQQSGFAISIYALLFVHFQKLSYHHLTRRDKLKKIDDLRMMEASGCVVCSRWWSALPVWPWLSWSLAMSNCDALVVKQKCAWWL